MGNRPASGEKHKGYTSWTVCWCPLQATEIDGNRDQQACCLSVGHDKPLCLKQPKSFYAVLLVINPAFTA